MGRWTQYEEDSYLLPEGFTRTAYDADTGRYTFRDRAGQLYTGASGELMKQLDSPSSSRPLFDTDKPRMQRSSESDSNPPPKSFQDILTPAVISSPLLTSNDPRSLPLLRRPSTFAKAIRRTAMQVVVQNLRRSATTMVRRPVDEATERLLRRNSTVSNKTNTSTSQSTQLSTSTVEEYHCH